ncbi:MAG TPA: hypothetical protein VGC23_07290 [Vicinamibacterales bacterium]
MLDDDGDGDGGQDDGGRDLKDIATMIRGYALGALAVPENAFRPLGGWKELPLAAAMEGRRFAKSVFRAEANPYEVGAEIAFAAPAAPLPDVARFRYEAGGVQLRVLEGASFYLLTAEGDWTVALPLVIQLDQPPAFAAPDANGWRSTNGALPLQRTWNWRDRIDAFEAKGLVCVLIFKVEARARMFQPRARW